MLTENIDRYKYTNFEQEKHRIIMNNLFYLLCGIDTKYISLGMNSKGYALIVSEDYPEEYLKPFEDICINVRIVNKFIFKSQPSTLPIKKILGSIFLEEMIKYFKIIIACRKSIKDIEYLFIELEESIKRFRQMKLIIDILKEKEEIEIYNFLSERVEDEFYKIISNKCYIQIEYDIINWVLYGKCGTKFMIKELDVDFKNLEFSFWESKYVLDRNQIPYNLQNDSEMILTCGKIINLIKVFDYSTNLDLNILKTRGLCGLYSHLNNLAMLILKKDLETELSILKDFVLMQNMSYFYDLFTDLYNDKSFNLSNSFCKYSDSNKKFIYKVNTYKNIQFLKFCISDTDLNNSIFKISGSELRFKNNQSILEFLTIDFKPKILSLLLNKKIFLELELIFRFLFTFSVIQFFLQKYFRFRFAKLGLYFIKNLIFLIHSKFDSDTYVDINNLIENICTMCRKYLNSTFMISFEIYLILSEIIDLFSNFISLDNKDECVNIEDFENAFIKQIQKLHDSIKYKNIDWLFINSLENIISPGFFKR